MNTEMGEYIVGACLKRLKECDFVDYNVRRSEGSLAGLNEIDVVGLDFKSKTAYLCEVTTHLDGLHYGKSTKDTVDRISKKHENLQKYAKDYLPEFTPHFMFWSPIVREGIAMELRKIKRLELIINKDYAAYFEHLKDLANKETRITGNPAFRLLQILGHLR